LHLDRIAGVVLVHRERRNVDRAVDADLTHRRHHLIPGDVRRPVRHPEPRPLRRVRRVGVDLGIDDCHRGRRFGLRLRPGLRAAQQRRPGDGERRPGPQHRTAAVDGS